MREKLVDIIRVHRIHGRESEEIADAIIDFLNSNKDEIMTKIKNENHVVRVWFIQTQPSPVEGAHAQEVSREHFFQAVEENPYVIIIFDESTSGLYLRFDLPLLDVV